MKIQVNKCPGTLKEGFQKYSPACLRNVFSNKAVDFILPYNSPNQSEEDNQKFIENRKRISISGVQQKLSLVQKKNKLRLTIAGEQGTHILKPIPRDLKFANQVPANEHLTMQIASQIYKIQTAANAITFFKTGEHAYLTKRFDIREDGLKWGVEDFASLAERTNESHGKNFKYENISYEELGALIKKYVGPYQIEIEKFYKLILFNFLFSNGDAHLKNFSMIETSSGDYILSPAYDLLNTRIHVADSAFALQQGLFADGSVKNPKRKDFLEFANKLTIKEKRRDKIFGSLIAHQEKVHDFIHRSFLNDKAKKGYKIHYNTRLNILKG